MMTKPSPSLTWRTFALILLTAVSALACSVPVFRYALEHWEADPYLAVVFHRGALTPEQQAQVQALKPAADAIEKANLSVTTVDVSAEMSPDHAEIWKAQPADAVLPRLVLHYPRSTAVKLDLVATPLAEAATWKIADSPVRRDILERLGDGQSAVWVLLESGDAAADDAAAKVLQERLDYLLGVLTLPELDAQDIANGLVSVSQEELRLDFSIIRLSRKNAEERTLIAMLMGSEDDLQGLADKPMVFPIFGQGRALYALVGKGISPETIEEAATFLIGKCSCQVKEQNPGIDLLFTADWKKLAQASPLLERDLPDLTALAKAAEPVTVTTEPKAEASVPKQEWPTLLSAAFFVLAFVMVKLWKRK
jgi:hypothetical protein